jgi:hypothetical protein
MPRAVYHKISMFSIVAMSIGASYCLFLIRVVMIHVSSNIHAYEFSKPLTTIFTAWNAFELFYDALVVSKL